MPISELGVGGSISETRKMQMIKTNPLNKSCINEVQFLVNSLAIIKITVTGRIRK